MIIILIVALIAFAVPIAATLIGWVSMNIGFRFAMSKIEHTTASDREIADADRS